MKKSYVNGETELNELSVEAAISSVIFEVIEKEGSPKQAAEEALQSFLLNKGNDYYQRLLSRVQEVKIEDLKRALQLYIAPLINPLTSTVAVVCNAGKAEAIYQSLKASLPALEMKETLAQAIEL